MDDQLLDHALTMVREPTVQATLDLERLIREADTPELAAEKTMLWQASEYTRQALTDRYRPNPYQPEQLAALPAGTLGGAYGRHMLRHHLSPNFYEQLDTTDDALYLRARMFETHDLMHVICGYDTSVLGETGISGFYFGQQDRYHGPGGGQLMVHTIIQQCAVFMHLALTDPEDARLQIRAFIDGYQRGRQAEPFLAYRLEDMWSTPLDRVRQLLHIEPAAG
jgi:ubiquinone biosynthesis protein COQ4